MAGGQGTRARPFTNHFPKAMMPILGRPMIEYIIDHLERCDIISDIIIICDLSGLGGQIEHHYSGYTGKKITFIQDSGQGTGGDLLHAPLQNESEFLLWFCDNLCSLDIVAMLERYRDKHSLACIATRKHRQEETGFADVSDGIITSFREKPILELPFHECLGMYILNGSLLDMIRQKGGPVNLSYDILQNLPLGSISAHDIGDSRWIDAESPAIIERNQKYVSHIIRSMSDHSSHSSQSQTRTS